MLKFTTHTRFMFIGFRFSGLTDLGFHE